MPWNRSNNQGGGRGQSAPGGYSPSAAPGERKRNAPEIFFDGLKNLGNDPDGWRDRNRPPSPLNSNGASLRERFSLSFSLSLSKSC